MANIDKTGNPVVKTLPDYVEENVLPLIAKSVLGAKSASLFNLQTGVKGPTKLNLINTDVVFQDASTCGFTPEGSTTLSQRQLTPAYLKVNVEWCDKEILGTWAQYQVKVAAGQKELPFEEEFVNGVIDNVKAGIENMIYQGDSANGDEFDGLIKILNADGAVKVTKKSTVYESVKATYAALPEEAIKEDTVILLGAGDFRTYIQELVAANLYHYEANDKTGEYVIPGTDVKVIAVNGLNGTDTIIAGRLSNMFYGTDMSGDEEKFELWYSKDDRTFKLVIEFMAGVQVAYPAEVVICA